MKPFLHAILSLSLVASGFGEEPRIVRIVQFYYESEGDLYAVESWIELNEGGRILQKFYDSTARTNREDPSLEQFELAQIEEYVGDLGRVWHPPLGEKPGVLHIPHRQPVEEVLRRLSFIEAYLGPVIRQEEGRVRPGWDQESLAEMKRLLERAGKEGGQGTWTDRFGSTIALQFSAGGKIDWIKNFQNGKPVSKAEVFETEAFPSITDNE